MNKFWKITICVGLALSIVAIIFCICRIFPRTYNLGIDYIGIIVGILSLLVTILIGWNIYTVLDIKCTISCNKAAHAPASPLALHKQILKMVWPIPLYVPFHSQNRERIALVIGTVTAEYAESHPFIEFHGRGILFVDIDISHILFGKCFLNQYPSYASPETARMEEEHFYFARLHAHESDTNIAVVCRP